MHVVDDFNVRFNVKETTGTMTFFRPNRPLGNQSRDDSREVTQDTHKTAIHTDTNTYILSVSYCMFFVSRQNR